MHAILSVRQYAAKRAAEILDNLGKNNLWRRIFKNTVATTVLVSISLIPSASNPIGKAAYLGAMTTVFCHPGRRFGQLAEALILALAGALLGLAWSTLGLYLSGLIIESSPYAAYTIRGLFLVVATIIHGFLRSYAPRLFLFVVLLIIPSLVTMLSTAKQVTAAAVTQILYPILIATGIILIVNLLIFPEFSSSFLGQLTIETLNDTAIALEKAGCYFTHISDHEAEDAKPTHSPGHTDQLSPPLSNKTSRTRRQSDTTTGRPRGSSVMVTLTHSSIATQLSQTGAEAVPMRPPIGKPSSQQVAESFEAIKISMGDLSSAKGALRKKLSDCKTAQSECNFELAYAVLPPRELKPISGRSMTKLLANVVAVISTCESKFALIGDFSNPTRSGSRDEKADETRDVQSETSSLDPTRLDLELVKPKREIEFGDVRLLRYLLTRVKKPYDELMSSLNGAIADISACIAYVYGVPKLPSGTKAPKYIIIEDLDAVINTLQQALRTFDADTTSALEGAAMIEGMEGQEPDIMPREELFLISSFLLNFRQAATNIQDMLGRSRELVDRRQKRHGRRRLYAPRIKWASWLFTGGEQDEALPASGRKSKRRGASTAAEMEEAEADASESRDNLIIQSARDEEEQAAEVKSRTEEEHSNRPTPAVKKEKGDQESSSEEVSLVLRYRGQLADALEWFQESDDFLYASKLTIAVVLLSWPAWIPSWSVWYYLNRGLWATFQLIFVTEVSLGTSIWTFAVRGIGTTLGCIWGWAAWEARNGNRIVLSAMICAGVIPSAYVQLGTKYPKAGMVSTISMCVVALSTELVTVPGTATENFLKRWIAFMIGGVVAIIVEMVIFPRKARTLMVESLAAALRQINEMENCIAAGIEEGKSINLCSPDRIVRFERASRKANVALAAAEMFLPFCNNEPRIKGSFHGLALIYTEILFVLHQIVDRMDNMLQLRTAYGSGPLEEFNAEIYPYRRNVAGSITVTLFAIHGALLTKLPLPQFIPSARLAHLRMINRVREVVQQSIKHEDDPGSTDRLVRQLAVRQKYMSWNAASAAQAEVIEFLEELVDLTKLLYGSNEFRSGLLVRPIYHVYKVQPETAAVKPISGLDGETQMDLAARDHFEMPSPATGLKLRRKTTTRSASEDADDIPSSLKRIQSRKMEAGIRRQRTNDSWHLNRK